MYSIITPGIPMYIALGNHDGEPSWDGIRLKARDWRLKCFPLPDQTTYPEGGHPEGKYYAFSWGADIQNRGGAQFIILDSTGFTGAQRPVTPEGWTLGTEQRTWFEDVLKKKETDWSFALFHHVLGGWPANSDGTTQLLAYGRGPLFNAQDYVGYGDPAKMEQVMLTEIAKQYGLRAFIYGHDHIFYHKKIGVGLNKRDLHAVCVGSPKYVGEDVWWRGSFWTKHYGDAFKENPDFFGPVGITKMSIKKDGVTVKYIKTGTTTFTNIAGTTKVADVVSLETFSNPLPSLFVDKASLFFQSVEGEANPPAQSIKIQNTGARALFYDLKSSQSWLSANPVKGGSWGEVDEISVSANIQGMSEGTYSGVLSVDSPGAAGSPQVVSVSLRIAAPPIYAPLQFTAARKLNKSLLSVENIIIISWSANLKNRNIAKYRLYARDAAGIYAFLREFESGTLSAMIRKAQASPYYFALTAVDTKGREGEAAYTSAL
jgi:hypothetical protein